MPPTNTTSHTLTNSQQHDSTYHLIKDSVVVYLGTPVVGTTRLASSETADADTALLLLTTRDAPSPHIERYHTEHRNRIVTHTDTVYRDHEVQTQLPPERYVPRAVRWLAWIGCVAILVFLLWLLWKIRG